jgi:hypothetical protein
MQSEFQPATPLLRACTDGRMRYRQAAGIEPRSKTAVETAPRQLTRMCISNRRRIHLLTIFFGGSAPGSFTRIFGAVRPASIPPAPTLRSSTPPWYQNLSAPTTSRCVFGPDFQTDPRCVKFEDHQVLVILLFHPWSSFVLPVVETQDSSRAQWSVQPDRSNFSTVRSRSPLSQRASHRVSFFLSFLIKRDAYVPESARSYSISSFDDRRGVTSWIRAVRAVRK